MKRLIQMICFVFCLFAMQQSMLFAAKAKADNRPNIIFILLDNVGKDWFRSYGSQENQTPNIDHLAYTGLRFRNCYVTPVCSTTRHMLLTGRYPFQSGWHTHHDPAIYGGGYFDWDREVCFARILRDAGYHTCISGKWQINDLFDPAQKDALKKHGFEEHCIFPEGKKGHPAHKQRYWDPYVIKNGQRMETKGKFGPDIFTDYLIEYMKTHQDRPFCAYYSAILTHIPVVSTPHNLGKELTPREKFAGMLNYSDHLIGRLVTAMDELGIRDNTILFIVPDNGTDNGTDQNAEQNLGGRINGRVSGEGIYSLKEQGINMPLIVNCPKLVGSERISDDLIDVSDVLPTLADLAKAPLPKGVKINGRSFAPQILNQPLKTPWRPWCLTQYYKQRVVRDQRFKLYSTGEFYDLSEDPLELHNLANSNRTKTDKVSLESYAQLRNVLDSLPENSKLPWEFRSISARRIRAEEARQKQAGDSNLKP